MNRNDRKVALAALVVAVLALIGVLLAGGEEGHRTNGAYGAHGANRTYGSHGANRAYGSHRAHGPHGAGPYRPYSAEPAVPAALFPFDPNTADSTQLLRLGLQPWQVRNIYRYRARGGVYRRKEDFARLYGLTVKDYRRLEPYIRISSDYLPASTLIADAPSQERDTVRYPVKIQETEKVVLNTADTAQLKKVPGIGSYYAREIVRYGQWLGGYVSVDQLDEIDHFPAAAKRYLVVENPTPQRLNVNQLSLQQLRRHPYINYHQAKTIVDYRRLHGPLHSLHDLRLSRDFPPEAIERLQPYVTF
ncbi:MAG: helix-hairpin-helix domain-containing protein [Prevotella sp.]|nr:helix-hairpin-helix domain-containing protein [Prevotella sp.]